MTTLRSRLRLWASAWLTFQVASLAALAPGACCATARTVGADRGAAAAGVHCPMPAADGSACPMHRARSAAEAVGAGRTARLAACACEGSSLFTLIATPGVLTDDPPPLFLPAAGPRLAHPADDPFGRLRRPDPRPPRA